MRSNNLPFEGKTYIYDYKGFIVRNSFSSENEVTYDVLAGPAQGITGTAQFTTRQISDTQYLITWQEEDGGTVVHLDDFKKGLSYSHYTNARHEFFVMDGSISEAVK